MQGGGGGTLTPEEIADLQAELNELQRQKNDLTAKKDDLQKQINDLKKEKARLENDRDQAEDDLQAIKDERDDLQELIKEKEKRERLQREAKEKSCKEGTDRGIISVCSRTEKVKNAIESAVGKSCSDMTICDLKEEVTSLDLSVIPDTQCNADTPLPFKMTDFHYLHSLEELDLSGNCLKQLEDSASAGFFDSLSSIKSIDLSNTGVRRLPGNFFNESVINTLEDGGVTVTEFIYCGNPEASFKDKLASSSSTDLMDTETILSDLKAVKDNDDWLNWVEKYPTEAPFLPPLPNVLLPDDIRALPEDHPNRPENQKKWRDYFCY